MAPYFITTPIYYVNDAPHIGTAYTTLSADAVARWHRLLGEDVLFLTGTDEHGLKMQRAAEANGLTPKEQADRYSARFVETWRTLNITNDDFIRTTEPRHYKAVGAMLQAAYDNGWIELGTYEGLYCVYCEAYYTEAELVEGNLCPIHRRPVETLREDNYFFKLSAFTDRLLEWYDTRPDFVIPASKRNEALGLIRGGLNDVSISRTSLTWGVPVPWDPAHVFYVWYDALINYATAAGYASDDAAFGKWWPPHHIIGKDILRFHCVYWPALCMAAEIAPPAQIAVHGFLLVGGEKMSKSNATQISPSELLPTFGVDGYRYHFLRDQAFGPDGDFSYEGMVARYNADLANNLGNLVSRVATVVRRKCDGIGPAPDPASSLAKVAADVYETAAAAWARIAPSEALEATWRLVRETNAALEESEPWKAEPGPAVDAVLGDALEALRLLAILASPAVPDAAAEIWRRIGLDGSPLDQRLPAAAAWGGYPGDRPVQTGPAIFPRIQG
ncbi:MAG TPA: methionine--tRNA ligase [Acidimicrobiales bacterium]|nr:methionine--tRNA ligase [Acidimicrobiales bacterium]